MNKVTLDIPRLGGVMDFKTVRFADLPNSSRYVCTYFSHEDPEQFENSDFDIYDIGAEYIAVPA